MQKIKNKFISAAEFRLYEKYKISVKNTYLTDMYMNYVGSVCPKEFEWKRASDLFSVNERKRPLQKESGWQPEVRYPAGFGR